MLISAERLSTLLLVINLKLLMKDLMKVKK